MVLYVVISLVVLAVVFVKMAIVIIPQSETRIIERLGKYFATLEPGINIIIPFIDSNFIFMIILNLTSKF